MQEVLKSALEAAGKIGIDILSHHQFEQQAAKTGRVLLSGVAAMRVSGDKVWRNGPFAITETVLILRGKIAIIPPVKIDTPVSGITYVAEKFQVPLIKRNGLRLKFAGKEVEILLDNTCDKFVETLQRAKGADQI